MKEFKVSVNERKANIEGADKVVEFIDSHVPFEIEWEYILQEIEEMENNTTLQVAEVATVKRIF
ncbi:hypothetical protein ACIQZG_18655 [Lysinibacillus sp. NPDC096418]|uniref:hypothetical protein n=1 Tax=Lysinibacillus sp. NPDC096418 TaxID=3364138 RepID=UPI00381B8E1E